MYRPIPAPFFKMEQQFAHRELVLKMEQQFPHRELVIKVEYGKTLRRISACVHGNYMDHNMARLRAKIIDFFKFSNDADFILSYIDEDGDTVALDNDDELRDAVISQRLNPLRIYVQLKSAGGSDVKSESSSQAKSPQSDTLPTVDEPLKSVPEPIINVLANLFNVVQNVVSSSPAFEAVKSEPLFRSAMESLSKDVKKVASFSPALAQVMDQFSKVGSSNPRKPSEPTGDSSGGEPKASTEPIPGSADPVPEQSGDVASSAALATDASRKGSASPYPLKVLPDSLAAKECSGKDNDVGGSNLDGKSANEDPHKSDNFSAAAIKLSQTSFIGPMYPYPRSPIYTHCLPPASPMHTLSSHIYNENKPWTFHSGVQCHGCGMHPIEGPRFKSNMMGDFDLCRACNDYTKIERASHRAPRPENQWHGVQEQDVLLRRCGVRPAKMELDSRFIQDVTVLYGSVMPPSTHFTKIWRFRNIGMVAWPVGSQLVWVSGDQFGDRTSVDLQISGSGLPVDKELDIAVNLTAPSRAGHYLSYWRMASPSGQRFGQRVSVNIQVGYSRPSSAASGNLINPDLNLNLPPGSSGRNGSVTVDVNAEPVDTSFTKINSMVPTAEWTNMGVAELVAPKLLVEQQPAAEVVGNLLDANNEASKSTTHSSVEETLLKELDEMGFKQIDLNKEVLRHNEYDLEQSVVNLCSLSEWDPLPSELNAMTSELNAMGFPNKELNKILLMKNGGSIKRAVLDLIAGKME